MSRVWIYQADRFLTTEEVLKIESLLENFVASWTAHGSALAGKGYVKYALFIVLEVDEEQAGVTGCSIDKSVRFVKSLEEHFKVGFLDRMKVSYKDNQDTVHLVNRADFEQLIKEGVIDAQTLVFNNLVQSLDELESSWEVPLKDSWHGKVFL